MNYFNMFRQNLRKYWPLVIIIGLATWLRVYQLPAKAILFGDSARDILAAIQAVNNHQLPLLGIPSSVPRFRQGPISIWLAMAWYIFFDLNLLVLFLIAALIGIITIIITAEFCLRYFNKKTAILVSLLIATSPLAISHSR
ncbi:MAG: hypothetical protein GF390_04285, partial [Candidatus Pacebacteria bacterium]|nr:hypothetical protein [Candidatus Paceibacterota bacterium]